MARGLVSSASSDANKNAVPLSRTLGYEPRRAGTMIVAGSVELPHAGYTKRTTTYDAL